MEQHKVNVIIKTWLQRNIQFIEKEDGEEFEENKYSM